MSSVRILAPAKVNLGLAILGKRSDGYHEIDTIMAMIDLCDEISISPSGEGRITIEGMDEIPLESNLMTKAARLWAEAAGHEPAWHIMITKHIPSPGGIGGGSSNAAAVLRGLNALHENRLDTSTMHDLAVQIGSDCPFFLGSPAARATGTGTDLRPLNPPRGTVVLAIPSIEHTAKTTTLYGALTPDDYGTRQEIDDIETQGIHAARLPNGFMRPALEAFPELSTVHREMADATGQAVLSGAGPGLYAISQTQSEARIWADELLQRLPDDITVVVAEFLQASPEPDVTS